MIAFRAHRAGVSQSGFTPSIYNHVLLPDVTPHQPSGAAGYDFGGRFINSLWVPIADDEPCAMVHFDGQLWIPDGGAVASGCNFVARIIKNGWSAWDYVGAKVAAKGPFAGDWVIDLSMQDPAKPGDSYGVYLFTLSAGISIDGNPLHSWWSGHVV